MRTTTPVMMAAIPPHHHVLDHVPYRRMVMAAMPSNGAK
jgi:hypothetical protein